MTFEDAKKLCIDGADIRHPHMGRGWIVRCMDKESGVLIRCNPFNGWNFEFIPNDHELERADWTAGQGLAAL